MIPRRHNSWFVLWRRFISLGAKILLVRHVHIAVIGKRLVLWLVVVDPDVLVSEVAEVLGAAAVHELLPIKVAHLPHHFKLYTHA